MSKKYRQLDYDERVRIALLLEAGLSLREIAEELGRSPSTISREARRNFPTSRTGDYLARNAESLARERRLKARKTPRLKTHAIRSYVVDALKRGWSPELISGRIKNRYA